MSIPNWLERTELLLGAEALARLQRGHVLVAGLGGVGAYAAEQIVRGGVGEITIIDGDTVQPSNRNRQLPALQSTEGKQKAEVMAMRLRDINPDLKLHVIAEYIRDERMNEILRGRYDFVIDAIDTLSQKVFLIANAVQNGLPLVSSLGAGGKVRPDLVRIDDISHSNHCRLGKVLRKRLHRVGIREGFQVVFSPEKANPGVVCLPEDEDNRHSIVGTISYMPAVFGCCCASVALRALAQPEMSG